MSGTSPAQVEIRFATVDDLPGMLECLAAAFEPFRARYTPEAFLHTVLDPELARARLAEMQVVVAIDGRHRVVGTVSWSRPSPDRAHLRGMAARPDVQGAGVAQSVLDWSIAELRKQGVRRVTLKTTEPLARAIRFYERNGFRPTGTVDDFHGMPVTVRERWIG